MALASALPPTDSAEPVTISVVHDHLELYENDETATIDTEPRKLYRCDRCPYANVRRDHLLTHMRFHLHRSSFHCPYCDYRSAFINLIYFNKNIVIVEPFFLLSASAVFANRQQNA